ncbi:MAG TPA: cobyric acid synthase [Acidobacteriaceae bacterium]
MVLGTSSHVGKSLLTAALCRIFAQEGYRVAPFKAQNMSLNSAATVEGLEIGRAQALQAEAAKIPASVHMNPILIKPTGDRASQIVVRGKIWRHMDVADYFQSRADELLPIVRESYEWLRDRNDIVVLEGAGSPAEINLKSRDIANMRMAELADAQCILIGDIDRGGVFASLLGTIELLDPGERERIRGFLINKFRGDIALLLPGIQQIQARLEKPCLGVVPYLHDLMLEEEDSLGLPAAAAEDWKVYDPERLRIAVIALPSLANFNDFDALMAEPSVSLRYCHKPDQLDLADVVLIPGSKETVKDLTWMREVGFEAAVLRHHARDGLTVGICGGMQMLGQEILDPDGIETAGSAPGFGLLPIETILQSEKITVNAQGILCEAALFGRRVEINSFQGYEIHVGQTIYLSGAKPFAVLTRAVGDALHVPLEDGCVAGDRRTFGTYLHGIFDDDAFRHAFLRAAFEFFQLNSPPHLIAFRGRKERELERLAQTVRETVDLDTIFSWVGLTQGKRPERQPQF